MLFANEQRRHVPQRRVKPKAWTVYLDHSVLYGTYYPSGVKRVRRGLRDFRLRVPGAAGRVKKRQNVIANENDYASQVLAA